MPAIRWPPILEVYYDLAAMLAAILDFLNSSGVTE